LQANIKIVFKTDYQPAEIIQNMVHTFKLLYPSADVHNVT